MRKLSPDSYVPSLLRCLYPYIYTMDDNRQKLTAERAAIVGRGVETVNSHCTKHNVLLRCFNFFLRRNPIPVPFDSHPLVPSSFCLPPLLILSVDKTILSDNVYPLSRATTNENYLVKRYKTLMDSAYLACFFVWHVLIRMQRYLRWL